MTEDFKPNKLRFKDVDGLSFWELLVTACHYGPSMSECINLNYGYTLRGDDIFCGETNLSDNDDISLKDPFVCLGKYAGLDLGAILKAHLKNVLSEYWEGK